MSEWTNRLNQEDMDKLNELIFLASKHRHVYKNSRDPAHIQFWTALLEVYKKQDKLNSLVSRLEKIIAKLETQLGSAEPKEEKITDYLKDF